MKYNKDKAWDLLLLLIRFWLAFRMIGASYSSVWSIINSAEERAFFQKWFGNELHFPFPVVMAFIAKGSEMLGGILLIPGFFTKPASALIAFTMLVATVTANLGENFIIDGGFTISYVLFALIFLIWGAGQYSVDHLLAKRKLYKIKTAL